jgi:kojibiose phosphorylase
MNLETILNKKDVLTVPGFSAKDPFNSSNITMTGNGYLGYRGTFPDWSADKYAGCTVTDTFDLADGKWKELCNVPNALFFLGELDGQALVIESENCSAFSHSLNYRYGVTSGSGRWKSDRGEDLEISWERYASYSDLHLIPQKINIKAHSDCSLHFKAGIDSHIWSLNGNHFSLAQYDQYSDKLVFQGKTTEKELPVIVAHRLIGPEGEILSGEDGLFRQISLDLKKGEETTIVMYMVVYSGNDVDDPLSAAIQSIDRAVSKGYNTLWDEHKKNWEHKWEQSFIAIEGDDLSQKLLQYNMYHNIISTPAHTDSHPIGARGLSCQAYQGSAFWDQEIYNLPMFLYTNPSVAKNILIYRYKTLAGAKRKAERLGFGGAFYAWISGDTGDELCPDYFFKDVITGRKIRNHFNDWQIHISPDISYTIIKYFEVTGDEDFIRDYGAEMLLEIALFLYSRVHHNLFKDRYEIHKVLGPDEYHENADNNTFTNTQAKFALEKTLEIVQRLKEKDPDVLSELQQKTGVNDKKLNQMKEIAGKMYIPEPDEKNGLIEQFDGYFQLEDIKPAELKARLIDEQEYWGWPNGIAYETQVTKQADVVQMFVLHDFPVDIMKANYLYYEARTQHRSSLSPGVHAIIAAQIGIEDQAYDYFKRSCSVDIVNSHPPTSGGTFIGGIHTAACGIAWQIAVSGFAGMKSGEGSLSFNPHLPEKWQTLTFSMKYRGCTLKIVIRDKTMKVECQNEPDQPFILKWRDQEKVLKEKGEISFG